MMYEVRLNVLNDKVDKFIVTESIYSHSGKKKKLNFDIKNYTKFKDKIKYIVIDKEPEGIIEENNDPSKQRANSLKRIELSYDAHFKENMKEIRFVISIFKKYLWLFSLIKCGLTSFIFKKGKIVGYKQQDVCTIRKVVREERIEEITGYRLKISADGEVLTLKSSRSYDAGDSITIRKRTTYSID